MSKTKAGFIALLGRPNAGKSTLLNALIGQKLAAVSAKAQTTRKAFRGIRTDQYGDTQVQMIFIDLPGLHIPSEGQVLNEAYMTDALAALEDVDALLYLVDTSREYLGASPGSDEAFILRQIEGLRAKNPELPLIVLLTKADLLGSVREARIESLARELSALKPNQILEISSEEKETQEAILEELVQVLPEHPLYFDAEMTSDEQVRTIAGELIQEQLFRCLGEEVPYECAVEITNFKEPHGKLRKTEIQANIHVERTSQRQIVVGAGGAKIREIGQNSRHTIERLLGHGVVLKLFVKHSPGWTKDPRKLAEFGYLKEAKQ